MYNDCGTRDTAPVAQRTYKGMTSMTCLPQATHAHALLLAARVMAMWCGRQWHGQACAAQAGAAALVQVAGRWCARTSSKSRLCFAITHAAARQWRWHADCFARLTLTAPVRIKVVLSTVHPQARAAGDEHALMQRLPCECSTSAVKKTTHPMEQWALLHRPQGQGWDQHTCSIFRLLEASLSNPSTVVTCAFCLLGGISKSSSGM